LETATEAAMNLNRIKLFSIVAKYSNLTKASQALHVSQSSLSHQMRLLQNDCATTLYKKTGRGVELTAAGRAFLAEALPLLQQWEEFRQKFKSPRTVEICASLEVGGSYGFSSELLPSVMANFQKKYPQVQVTLRTGNYSAIEQLVLKGDVEVALVTFPESSPWLAMEPYGREKIAAFVSVRHPLAKKASLTVSEVLANPFVIRAERGPDSNFKKMLRDLEIKGYTLNITAYYDLPDAVKVAVAKRTGIGLLYEKSIRPDVQRGAFKILDLEGLQLYGHSFIIYHKDRPLSTNAKRFLELLRQRRRQMPLD
jgi:DNA-binding transcriptional LysR family regulator